jgi:hypothetical protein
MTSRSLVEFMRLSPEAWDEIMRGSPLRRARREGLLGNVAVAPGNFGIGRGCASVAGGIVGCPAGGATESCLGTRCNPLPFGLRCAGRAAVRGGQLLGREELELALARFSESSSSRGRSGADLSVHEGRLTVLAPMGC